MPAEPTKAKLKRRASRKDLEEYRFDGGHGRELELKRNRGEVSCAECRRLKIKCDKQIPCQSCQRRGCAALCPNGSLATGQGTRFVLAATEHLHRRIAKLSGRIRQLEDALSTLHAKHSSEPHPLLHEDLIHVDERDGDVDGMAEEGSAAAAQAGEVLEAFGTLSISEHGISRFFGPTGGSESLLLANLDSQQASPEACHTPPDVIQDANSPSSIGDLSLFSQSFPFTPMGQLEDVQNLIETHLPPFERTVAFCETYFEQVYWLFHGVTRLQLMDDMLPVIYKQEAPTPGEDYSGPHDLALLFMILAIGALVGKEPSNALGEHFYQVARAAISLQPVLEKPSIVTIQTLHLMSIYNAMSGSDLKSETSMEMTWSLITLAAHLSQTIGLHRDSARWGLTPKMVQRRRILFWDLFVADVWTSLNTGRPPSFSLAYIDCSYPEYGAENGFGSAFEVWQCRFAAECVAEVTAKTLTAEAPTYSTIMELDRKVRDFPLPEGISKSADDLAASFQRCVLEHIRETVLMYIHRSFFAQAIIEHPVNPLKSAYAPSFLAAYRASSTILKSIRENFNIWPNSSSRFWSMWTFAFSAAVVFGTVVTRGPRSPLAQPAMAELEQACILFSKASVYSIRAAKALPILTKLSEKARLALAAAQSDPTPLSGDKGGILWNIKQEDTDDELSIFAGHTRFVSGKRSADSSNTSPPHALRLEPTPPLYLPSSNPQTSPPEGRLPDTRGHPDPPSNYQPPLGLAESSSSSTISSANNWNPIQSSDQYMSSSMSNERYSYVSPEQSNPLPSSGAAPETSYGWPTRAVSQSSHHPMDVTPHYEHSPLNQTEDYPRSQPQQHHRQYHVHAAHDDSIDLHPQARYAPQYLSQHRHPDTRHQHPQHLTPSLQQPHHYSSSQSRQYAMYSNGAPGYHLQAGAPTTMDLADLGIASRDSRLDERWSSFIADSGLVGDFRGR